MKRVVRTLLAALLLAVTLPAVAAGAAPAEAALTLTAEEQAFVESAGTLKVGYVQDRIPISFQGKDGELAGVSRYIFDRLAELSGLQFEYVALPMGDVTYDYLQTEGFDLVTSVEYNKENLGARGILTSEPYLSSRKVVVARPGLDFDFNASHSVAISSGSQTIRKVLAESYPHFQVHNYDSISDCFEAVRAGREDLMIQNQFVVEYWIAKPANERLNVIPVLGMDDQLCFSAVVAFNGGPGPAPERGQTLIAVLNKAIAAMGEDEVSLFTIKALMENRYHYTMEDFLYRYRFGVTVLCISLCIIAALLALMWRQRLRALADRADAKAKGQFLSTMSHEIRTPLNGLIGLNYLMAQNLDDRPRLEEQLHKSTNTAQYLLTVVNDILDMSQLEAHQVELHPAPMDLPLLVDAVRTMVEGGMADKGLRFAVESELPYPTVLGDAARIQQVVLNLLDNARKFTPAGGQVTLRVRQTKAGEAVLTRIEVQDNGQGMSEAFQKQVFSTFSQELDTVSKGNQGTGLGLSISRSLARLMGGDLTVNSQKGAGSRFVFTFPAPVADTPAPQAEVSAGRGNVLVAEDNELNAEIMTELLTEAGFTVLLAKNGREAVERFRASPVGSIPIVLMDLLMPELDGFQATAAIRALDRPDAATVCIIACTANAAGKEEAHARQCGMDDFLTKPVDVHVLLEKLAAHTAPA